MPNNNPTGKNGTKGKTAPTDADLITAWPADHKEPVFFMHMYYNDAHQRTKESKNAFVEMIIYKSAKGSISIIELDNPECLPEHREKLKSWDTVTYLPIWCALNDIPCKRFSRTIMRFQIHSIKGSYFPIELEGTRTKRKCALNKNSPLTYTNTIFRGF